MRFLSTSLIALTAGLSLAASAPAPAVVLPGSQPQFIQPQGKSQPARAGYINANGSIGFGHGFTAVHTGTGQYKITYSQGDFKYFPAMSVTPFGLNGGLPLANLNGVSCGSGSCIFYVGTYATNGTAMDNGFAFVIVEAK